MADIIRVMERGNVFVSLLLPTIFIPCCSSCILTRKTCFIAGFKEASKLSSASTSKIEGGFSVSLSADEKCAPNSAIDKLQKHRREIEINFDYDI